MGEDACGRPSVPSATAPKPKRRWCQYSLRMLLLFVLVWSVFCSWISTELRKADRRRRAFEQIDMEIYTCDLPEFPWYSRWLHQRLGQETDYDLTFLVFHNFSSINDDTLAAVAQFDNLEQLWLNGDISVTDGGLERLKGLKRLRDLSLGDAPVTVQAVEALRRALPMCEISWEPPTPLERQSRAGRRVSLARE